uniref:Transposase n=1 Tax=Steinernema glaseri TaxID=37863 RepID=A0A1I7ZJB7_9BILA
MPGGIITREPGKANANMTPRYSNHGHYDDTISSPLTLPTQATSGAVDFRWRADVAAMNGARLPTNRMYAWLPTYPPGAPTRQPVTSPGRA